MNEKTQYVVDAQSSGGSTSLWGRKSYDGGASCRCVNLAGWYQSAWWKISVGGVIWEVGNLAAWVIVSVRKSRERVEQIGCATG